MNKNPLVSIIIPTYNYAAYAPKAALSCLEQSYQPIETIVVDDGSTDNTHEVLAPFQERIHYVYQPNQGVSSARNRGLYLAKGEFIAFLDADDYLTKNAIETRVNILLEHPDIGIVATEKYMTRPEAHELIYKSSMKQNKASTRFYEDLLLKKVSFSISSALIRGELAKQFRFSENITNGEDIAYFAKLLYVSKAYFLAEPTVVVVRHQGSSRYNIEKIKKQEIALVQAIFDDPFYQGKLNYLRNEFTANRYLSLSRSLFLAEENKEARKRYLQAIAIRPLSVMKWNYLSKFLRSFLS
jgi:glycosyltransferase involved in cell wall biosynthesis